jgi:hypothetical protein
MECACVSLLSNKHADEIRDMWQSRALREADGKLQRVLLIALAKEYPGDLLHLLRATFGTEEIGKPFYSGYATIITDGHIVCMMHDVDKNRLVWKGIVSVFDNEQQFIKAMRRLADTLKLSDPDRIDMFRVLQKWVTADQRVGVHGERLAS